MGLECTAGWKEPLWGGVKGMMAGLGGVKALPARGECRGAGGGGGGGGREGCAASGTGRARICNQLDWSEAAWRLLHTQYPE